MFVATSPSSSTPLKSASVKCEVPPSFPLQHEQLSTPNYFDQAIAPQRDNIDQFSTQALCPIERSGFTSEVLFGSDTRGLLSLVEDDDYMTAFSTDGEITGEGGFGNLAIEETELDLGLVGVLETLHNGVLDGADPQMGPRYDFDKSAVFIAFTLLYGNKLGPDKVQELYTALLCAKPDATDRAYTRTSIQGFKFIKGKESGDAYQDLYSTLEHIGAIGEESGKPSASFDSAQPVPDEFLSSGATRAVLYHKADVRSVPQLLKIVTPYKASFQEHTHSDPAQLAKLITERYLPTPLDKDSQAGKAFFSPQNNTLDTVRGIMQTSSLSLQYSKVETRRQILLFASALNIVKRRVLTGSFNDYSVTEEDYRTVFVLPGDALASRKPGLLLEFKLSPSGANKSVAKSNMHSKCAEILARAVQEDAYDTVTMYVPIVDLKPFEEIGAKVLANGCWRFAFSRSLNKVALTYVKGDTPLPPLSVVFNKALKHAALESWEDIGRMLTAQTEQPVTYKISTAINVSMSAQMKPVFTKLQRFPKWTQRVGGTGIKIKMEFDSLETMDGEMAVM